MPKDEFDFADPFELNRVVLPATEDTTDVMCECFIEEFMRMDYGAKQILALFRNPHYLGMNLVLEKRGEPFVREAIASTFATWGRQVNWQAAAVQVEERPPKAENAGADSAPPRVALADQLTDPMGAAIPTIHL
jgi:hypothetical protein